MPPPPSSMNTDLGYLSSPHVIVQDDDGDLEGESEEDLPEFDPEIRLDLNL